MDGIRYALPILSISDLSRFLLPFSRRFLALNPRLSPQAVVAHAVICLDRSHRITLCCQTAGRGQVHVFGQPFVRKICPLAEKMDQSRLLGTLRHHTRRGNLVMGDFDNLGRRAAWAGDEPIVAVLMAKTLGQPDLISLAAGFVDHETLPVEPTRRAMETIWSNADLARAALQYGTTIGYPPLRKAVLDRMLQADGKTAARAERRPRKRRHHRRQQPVVVPGWRRAFGSRATS